MTSMEQICDMLKIYGSDKDLLINANQNGAKQYSVSTIKDISLEDVFSLYSIDQQETHRQGYVVGIDDGNGLHTIVEIVEKGNPGSILCKIEYNFFGERAEKFGEIFEEKIKSL